MTQRPKSLPAGWVQARRYHLLAPLLMLGLVALMQHSYVAQLLEEQTVNLRFQAREGFDRPADPRLIFVGIDEFSLSYLGRWPWSRVVHGQLLNTLAQVNDMPHTIAFDITFTEPSAKTAQQGPNPDPQSDPDGYLGDAIGQNYSSVITGAQIVYPTDVHSDDYARALRKKTDEELASLGPTAPLTNFHGNIDDLSYGSDMVNLPVPALRSQSLFGFVNDDPKIDGEPSHDGIRRTCPLVVRVKDKVFPALALQTLCQMLSVDPGNVDVDLPHRRIELKDISGKIVTIPITEKGEYFVNYRRQEGFTTISYGGLLQNALNCLPTPDGKPGAPINPKCDVRNKTLFIGESAFALTDLGPTPLRAKSPLPFVHLNVINNVLQHDYLTFVPWYWVVIGWSLITWPTLLRLKVAPLVESIATPIGIAVVYVLIAFAIFWLWSIQIVLAWPVLSYGAVNFGGVVLRWREEAKGRQQIKGIFSQMVSPEVMNHLLKNPENMRLGGSDRPSTILFSDIRDYTGFSEGKTAEDVMNQLNVYFERMVNCITECKGSVHKFIGDAVMAGWGEIAEASLGPEQDARNAVKSTLLMRVRLRELNAERKELGLTPIRIGVGLNHGIVQAGMLGSTGRKEFTMIGDEVNVASRLEGITKEFHTDIAISESVRHLLGDEFLVRRLGFIQLKGKTTPTLVYEVLAAKGDAASAKMSPAGVAQYEQAFDHFLARRFEQAEAGFLACQKNYPDDYCTNQYLNAAREFIVNPPPPEWDGRIVMKTK